MPIVLRNVGASSGDNRERILKNLITPPLVSTAPGRRNGFRGALDGGGGGDPVDTTPITDWQLDVNAYDYAYASEMVCPRPMAELTSNSAFLWGHPDFDYVRCFHARGGAWPYHWEVVSGPTGTTIGEFLEEDANGNWVVDAESYSVLTVPKQPEGTVSTVVVRMRDQNWQRGPDATEEILIELDITWQADKWVFLAADGTGASASAGDVSDPLDIVWYKDNAELFPDRLVYIRGGEYPTDLHASLDCDPGVTPTAYLAPPGENPILHDIRWSMSGTPSDFYFQGLTLETPYLSGTIWYFVMWSGGSRTTIVMNNINNAIPGDGGTPSSWGNPAGVHSSKTSNSREFVAVARNHFSGFRDDMGFGNNFSSMILYSLTRSVQEMNRVSDCQMGESYWIKAYHKDSTFRLNVEDADVDTNRGAFFLCLPPSTVDQSDSSDWDRTGGVEVCWNDLRHGEFATMTRGNGSDVADFVAPGEYYAYRNLTKSTGIGSTHRNNCVWNIWNNLGFTVAKGDSTSNTRSHWGTLRDNWGIQRNNPYLVPETMTGDVLNGTVAQALRGKVGSIARPIPASPTQAVTGGIQNVQSWGSSNTGEDVSVTLGEPGRNRMLVLVMFQNGDNARGVGCDLEGVFGNTLTYDGGQWNARLAVHCLADHLLPGAGTYTVKADEGGTVTAFALYMEGASQTAKPLEVKDRGNGDTLIPGHISIPNGTGEQLALCIQRTDSGSYTLYGSGSTHAHQQEGPRHHAVYRLGADSPIGFNEEHTGIIRALAFSPAESVSGTTEAFTPMYTETYSSLSTDDSVSAWRRSAVSEDRSRFGTKSLKLRTATASLPPACGGSNYFGNRQSLPEVVTEGYTVWQRMWMYFPSTFSFGHTYSVRDTTEMAESAASGATSININRPGTVALQDGHPLYITLDDGDKHFTYVNGGTDIYEGEVDLLDPLPSAASAGNNVHTYDKAEAAFCNTSADAGTSGIKWLVFAPDSGTRRIYTKIGSERRQIEQGPNARLAIESEVPGHNDIQSYTIPLDQWVCFQMAVKVSSGTDGYMRIWIDDQLMCESLDAQTIESSDGATGLDKWGLGDYWNGIPWTDGAEGRDEFYIDNLIVASDLPGYGAPTGVDANGNPYIDPNTRAEDLT